MRVFNFAAGPAVLPTEVLEEVRAAMPKDRKNAVADDNGGGNGRH